MRLTIIVLTYFSLMACTKKPIDTNQGVSFLFSVKQGVPTYSVSYKDIIVIKNSKLEMFFNEDIALNKNMELIGTKEEFFDQTWKPVLGEVSHIRNKYKQTTYFLKQKSSNIQINIVFRLFDEGIAFRYEFPVQSNLNYFVINSEKTEFNLAGNHICFWITGDFDSQEYAYNETRFSDITNKSVDMNNGIALKSIKNQYNIQSPLMMKTDNGLYINIFEAAVDNYPVMHLKANPKKYKLVSVFAPNALGNMAYLQTPSHTPWRTVIVSNDARDIVASKIILNLNEPCKIANIQWIKPMKYVGIWWEMHVGLATWDYAGSQNGNTTQTSDLQPTGKHGATTENTKRYIDFAAKHGFDGVLVEGWNIGWEDWFGNWKENVFDFITPYPDFDIQDVCEYAKQKGVKMIMHHETSGSASNYERYLDRAFNLMKKYNYSTVKTGYVGRIIPRGEYHDGQTMVNHFHHVVKRAADYQIMVNSHESSRPTGIHRTYPNYIAAEAVRGNEFNAWSYGNPPSHETILPFTRLMGGPIDYTPGIFEIKMNFYDPSKTEQIHTTLAKQLALYVTLYSPLQMAADLPENYEKHIDAFQFIKDVAVDWDNSIYIEAEPGDYITVARKAKNSENWFLGSITDENKRKTTIMLDFLTKGINYNATIYCDGKDAHWKTNPMSYEIKRQTVNSNTILELSLAAGGGVAVSLFPEK